MRERMGSGGPRGLQILLSVADRGRGGFDSHTFPPLVLLLALALVTLAVAPRAWAQRAAADTSAVAPIAPAAPVALATPADTSAAHAKATPALARPVGERPRPWHATPFAIMARSALVPGWGQAANKRWLKAVIVAGGEGWAGARFLKAWSDVRAADRQTAAALARGDQAGATLAQAEYDQAFQRRASAGWLFSVAAVLSMMDAYVDAHFLQFDADFGPDPALPDEGAGSSSLRTVAPTLRVAVRFRIP